MLLDVEPEVENVFCAFSLEKETNKKGKLLTKWEDCMLSVLEHEQIHWWPCSSGKNLGKTGKPVATIVGPFILLSLRVVHSVEAVTASAGWWFTFG